MFSVSKETYVIGSDAIDDNATYGRYTRLKDEDVHADLPRCFVAPELSQIHKVHIDGFPEDGKPVIMGNTVDFVIVKNGAPGNIAVHVIPPGGPLPLRRHVDVIELSADSYVAHIPVIEEGIYSVHVRFNDVELPTSPMTFCGARADHLDDV